MNRASGHMKVKPTSRAMDEYYSVVAKQKWINAVLLF